MLASFSSLATAAPFKTSFRNQIRSGFLLFLRLLTRDKRRHYTFYVKADVFIDSARNSATKWFLNLAKFKQPDSHWPMFILEDVCYCCIIAVLTLVPLMREKRVAGFKITMLFPTLVMIWCVSSVHAERSGCRNEEAAGRRWEENHKWWTLVSGPARA